MDIFLPKFWPESGPYLYAFWVILHAILSSIDYFQNQLFQNISSGIPSECQAVLGPDPNILKRFSSRQH